MVNRPSEFCLSMDMKLGYCHDKQDHLSIRYYFLITRLVKIAV